MSSRNSAESAAPGSPGDPRILSVTKAAGRLGIDRRTLQLLRRDHELYEPSAGGFPGAGGRMSQHRGFHIRHLELIEAARLGVMDADEALIRWNLAKARMRAGKATGKQREGG